MNERIVYDFLEGLFDDLFPDGHVKLLPTTSAADVHGWDSLKQVEIILATEERFGIKMSTREIDNLNSIEDLVRVVCAKTEG